MIFPRRLLLLLAAATWLMYAACSSGPPPEEGNSRRPDRVLLKLDGGHGSPFLGFFAARDLGFYAAEGLEVVIEDSPDTSELDTIPFRTAGGEFDFAVGSGELAEAQKAGLPLVALAGIFRYGPQALLARSDAGIAAPADLAGKRVVVKSLLWRAWLETLLAGAGLTLDDVEEVPGGEEMSSFLAGDVDVWAGLLSAEVPGAREEGMEIVVLPLHEHGVTLPGQTLYTRRGNVEERPDLVGRFVGASLRGWNWAVENPEEAVDEMLASYPGLVEKREYWQRSFRAVMPLIASPGRSVGEMDCASWRKRLGPGGAALDDSFCDSRFLGGSGGPPGQ